MTMNGITCVGYRQTPDGFVALLRSTIREQVLAINPAIIEIKADDGVVVESFVGFGAATRITEDLTKQQFEVFFPCEDGGAQRITALEGENAGLKTQMQTMAQAIAMMQIGGMA